VFEDRRRGGQPTRSTDEQFLALVLCDEQLVRAEFEAIIEASSDGPPSNSVTAAVADRWPDRSWSDPTRAGLPPIGPPGGGGSARQRSPPGTAPA
jgi:hypothetical protein